MLELNFNIKLWCRPHKFGKALGSTLWRRREALCGCGFKFKSENYFMTRAYIHEERRGREDLMRGHGGGKRCIERNMGSTEGEMNGSEGYMRGTESEMWSTEGEMRCMGREMKGTEQDMRGMEGEMRSKEKDMRSMEEEMRIPEGEKGEQSWGENGKQKSKKEEYQTLCFYC